MFICVQKGYLDPWMDLIDASLPYVILGAGFLLGLRFHRSRLAFVVLILVLADRLLYYFGPNGVIGFNYAPVVLQVAALLLPINIGLLYFVRERGILNFVSLLHCLFILAQPLAVYYLLETMPELFSRLNHQFIKLYVLSSIGFPQVTLFIWAVILLIFLVGSMVRNQPVVRGFFWALATSGMALYTLVNEGQGVTLYFSAAGLIVILSVIETAYAMAFNDELTGLPARRSLNTTLQGLGRSYTIAMLDIDFFKKFNDKYGHDVGDQVLCMVASHIRRVGGGGKPFRYGGEEFTVVFPGKTKKEARPHLESLREAIADSKFALRDKSDRPKKTPKKRTRAQNIRAVSVTISIGAAEPSRTLSKPADVIKAADKALYRAKQKGRNRVVA